MTSGIIYQAGNKGRERRWRIMKLINVEPGMSYDGALQVIKEKLDDAAKALDLYTGETMDAEALDAAKNAVTGALTINLDVLTNETYKENIV